MKKIMDIMFMLMIVFALAIGFANAEECNGHYDIWLTHGQPVEISDHIVEVYGASDNEDMCMIFVDGDQYNINVGDKETIDDISIKTLDAIAVYGPGDVVEEDWNCQFDVFSYEDDHYYELEPGNTFVNKSDYYLRASLDGSNCRLDFNGIILVLGEGEYRHIYDNYIGVGRVRTGESWECDVEVYDTTAYQYYDLGMDNSKSTFEGQSLDLLSVASGGDMCGIDIGGISRWIDVGNVDIYWGNIGVHPKSAYEYYNLISRGGNDNDQCELEIIPCECDSQVDCPIVCSDPDGDEPGVGNNFGVYTKTTASGPWWQSPNNYVEREDRCTSATDISESYCRSDGVLGSYYIRCPNGCEDGACLREPASTCTETDGGRDYNEKGTVTTENSISKTDYCTNEPWGNHTANLIEYYCQDGQRMTYGYDCPYGCENGACRTVPKITCTDSDGGSIYIAGEVTESSGSSMMDYCTFISNRTGILYEASCSNGDAVRSTVTCPSNAPYCNRGACSSIPAQCTDTDGGKDTSVRGTITEPRLKDGPQHTDYCQNMDTKQPWNDCSGDRCGIREYYCGNPYVTTTYNDVNCPYGCKDGVCLEGSDVQTDCNDMIEKSDAYWSDNGITNKGEFNYMGPSEYLVGLPYIVLNGKTVLAEDEDEIILLPGQSLRGKKASYPSIDIYLEGTFFVYTTLDGQSRLIEITNLDYSGLEIEFRDTRTGRQYSDDLILGQTGTYTLGTLGKVQLKIVRDYDIEYKKHETLGGATAMTKSGATVKISDHGLFISKGSKMMEYRFTSNSGVIAVEEICSDAGPCTDSDGGRLYYQNGEVCTGSRCYSDVCKEGQYIKEYYCDAGTVKSTDYLYCSYGCMDGECLEKSICSDSDGGLKYDKKGSVTDSNGRKYTDVCSANDLIEYYCSVSQEVVYKKISCESYGKRCNQGACIYGPEDGQDLLREPLKGKYDAPVKFQVYMYYPEPYSKKFWPVLEQISDEFEDEVSIEYSHFPLWFGEEAGMIGECVLALGGSHQFYTFTDSVYDSGQSDVENLIKTALEIGIDEDKLQTCMASKKYLPEVLHDEKTGKELGVSGIPSFFINGKKYSGALSYDKVKDLIEEALDFDCIDTDGGKDYYTKGTAYVGSGSVTQNMDSCNGDYVTEYYCSSEGSVDKVKYFCTNGCDQGECKLDFDMDISTDQINYQYGDPVEITVTLSSETSINLKEVRLEVKVEDPDGKMHQIQMSNPVCTNAICKMPVGSSLKDCDERFRCEYAGEYFIDQIGSVAAHVDVVNEDVVVKRETYNVFGNASLDSKRIEDSTKFQVYRNNGYKYVELDEKFLLYQTGIAYVVDGNYLKLTNKGINCSENCVVILDISYLGKTDTIKLAAGESKDLLGFRITASSVQSMATLIVSRPKDSDVKLILDDEYRPGESIDIKVKNDGTESIYYYGMCTDKFTVYKDVGGEPTELALTDPCAERCLGLSIEELKGGEIVSLGTWSQKHYLGTCQDDSGPFMSDPGRYGIEFKYFNEDNLDNRKSVDLEFEIIDTADCDGCMYSDRCLPVGTRLVIDSKPMFCQVDHSFDAQDEVGKYCMENHECLSNQCSNGRCIDLKDDIATTNQLLSKLINWIIKLLA